MELGVVFFCDGLEHGLEAFVCGNSTCEENLMFFCVGKCAFGDFGDHAEGVFLEAVAEVGEVVGAFLEGGCCCGEESAEGEVHAFDDVGKVDEVFALGGEGFDLCAEGFAGFGC